VSLYVDTSALLKRYISEDESNACERILLGDPSWITARHTWVEVARNLAKLLTGSDRRAGRIRRAGASGEAATQRRPPRPSGQSPTETASISSPILR